MHQKRTQKRQALNGCSVGFSVGPQRVLSECSGCSWVLRLFIFEYSGGSQVGTSPRGEGRASGEGRAKLRALPPRTEDTAAKNSRRRWKVACCLVLVTLVLLCLAPRCSVWCPRPARNPRRVARWWGCAIISSVG